MKALTGIAIVNRKGYDNRVEKLAVSVSEDGATWREVAAAPGGKSL